MGGSILLFAASWSILSVAQWLQPFSRKGLDGWWLMGISVPLLAFLTPFLPSWPAVLSLEMTRIWNFNSNHWLISWKNRINTVATPLLKIRSHHCFFPTCCHSLFFSLSVWYFCKAPIHKIICETYLLFKNECVFSLTLSVTPCFLAQLTHHSRPQVLFLQKQGSCIRVVVFNVF